MYKHYFKRCIDFCIAFVALSILLIPLALITLWLHFANKGAGAFFFQERPGKDGKIFRIVKFKTMTDEKDENGNLLPDVLRVTKVGKLVRSTSIDELPQLWNVLIGEMSLIGPRPLLPQYIPWYTEEEWHRHDVRPGITGMAQSHGRTSITWEDTLAYDMQYVNNISLKTDIEIIFKTIIGVLKRKDVAIIPTCDFLDEKRKKEGMFPFNERLNIK